MVCPITTNDRFLGDGILLRIFYVVFLATYPPDIHAALGSTDFSLGLDELMPEFWKCVVFVIHTGFQVADNRFTTFRECGRVLRTHILRKDEMALEWELALHTSNANGWQWLFTVR